MPMTLSDHIESCLKVSPIAIKQLPNGYIRWYPIEGTSFNLIYTHWLDNAIHLEYRDMKNTKSVTVVYSDLPQEKPNAMFNNIDDVKTFFLERVI